MNLLFISFIFNLEVSTGESDNYNENDIFQILKNA